MSELKATPGPWRVGKSIYQSQARVVAEKGGRVADVFAYEEDQAHANAALIAAAPEMYDDLFRADDLLRDALKRINPNSGLGRCIEEQLKRNMETMKKAKGEE